MKGKIYLSGPISANPKWQEDFKKAEETVAKFWQGEIISPRQIAEQLKNDCPGEVFSWQDYMRIDLLLLLTCDVIALLPGWENSKGAILEQQVAQALGLHEMHLRLDK